MRSRYYIGWLVFSIGGIGVAESIWYLLDVPSTMFMPWFLRGVLSISILNLGLYLLDLVKINNKFYGDHYGNV